MSVKREVLKRANNRCEKCSKPLESGGGDFHHALDPTVKPRATSVRYLCPNCHREFGHHRKSRTETNLFGSTKKSVLIRKRVVDVSSKKPSKTVKIKTTKPKSKTTKIKKTLVKKPKPIKKKVKRKKSNDWGLF